MMQDTDSEQYKARAAIQLEACALGGTNCAIEYHRIGAKDVEDRTEEEAKKYRLMSGTNTTAERKRLRDKGDNRNEEETKKLARMSRGRIIEWSSEEDKLLMSLASNGNRSWGDFAKRFPGKDNHELRCRWETIRPDKVKKTWSRTDDERIIAYASAPENKAGARIKWGNLAKSLDGRTNYDCAQRYSVIKGRKTSSSAKSTAKSSTKSVPAKKRSAANKVKRMKTIHLFQGGLYLRTFEYDWQD
ncbi:hypothetical protein THAOC_13132 [Thalassiosira oceanica]|uniref:Myb-like domain-containing protein n=1 Tax=Thalassiosira oceanica TaxID=159749 RepID=K0SKW2_THAOC|nr:hypothetical protein THAOC_13132 [Thalassiosira oceanica]|eukprot:EJK65970.1 hypothetical protein THAOC_13132 [Thalassiosira oceanica]